MRCRTGLIAAVALAASQLGGACRHQHAPPVAAETSLAPAGWTARTLPELGEALAAGEITSEALVEAYLDRIERIDGPRPGGPSLQSVLALNPEALAEARALDARQAAGEPLGALHGIPILLKDNIEAAGPMATTAGAIALKDNVTGRDSPLVAGLRREGAVILGKSNLSQWANYRSELSLSGWSALGGQVRNPHVLDRNPCGSSSGSGAAVAASLAAGAVGTETNGSIICPANVNGVVGFKPTVGLVPQMHIVPISFSQDTAGPMTRTVRGAAMMLDAMAEGVDAGQFSRALDAGSLAGARIGVLRFSVGTQPHIVARFDAALATLADAGAVLVEIETFDTGDGDFWQDARTVLDHEFKATLDAYLATSPADIPVRSLADLIEFNRANPARELALFGQDIFETANATDGLDNAAYLAARERVQRQTRELGLDRLLDAHDVDVLVAPSGPLSPRIDPVNGDVWPDWSGAGYLAAIAGYPHLSVPMGEVYGIPIGLSFIGGANADAAVLSFGYGYEQASQLRPEPGYLPGVDHRQDIASALAPMPAD